MSKNLFDIVIALTTVSVPLFLVDLHLRWRTISAKGLYTFLSLFLVVVWGMVVYGSFVEPNILVVKNEEIRVGDGDKKLRMVLISDIHLGRYRRSAWLEKLVQSANQQNPDVIILLGDNVDGLIGLPDLEPLTEFNSTYGTYAVLGNSDYATGAVEVRTTIERYAVEVMTNEWFQLGENGPVLVGVDDLWYGTPDYNLAVKDVPENIPIIMASHNPDSANYAEYVGVDLLLSGHTHGGQIRLPYIGSVAPIPTQLNPDFDKGFFSYGKMMLYITSGCGESGPRSRLFNPPELVVLDMYY